MKETTIIVRLFKAGRHIGTEYHTSEAEAWSSSRNWGMLSPDNCCSLVEVTHVSANEPLDLLIKALNRP